jgi:hypothetical protein
MAGAGGEAEPEGDYDFKADWSEGGTGAGANPFAQLDEEDGSDGDE